MTDRAAHLAAIAAAKAQLTDDDPRLMQLIENFKRASDELVAYMAARCEAAGVELPEEWRGLRGAK